MAKLESKFQKEFIDKVKERYSGSIALKNDSSYIQGFPDWTILYEDKWAVLEMKKERGARKQPNQEYYVDTLNKMGLYFLRTKTKYSKIWIHILSVNGGANEILRS